MLWKIVSWLFDLLTEKTLTGGTGLDGGGGRRGER